MNRRQLLVGGAALALLRPAAAVAQASREAEAFTDLLRVEHTSVFAYDHVLGSGRLRGDAERLARALRQHEAEHVAALAKTLTDMRRPLPQAPERLDQVEVPQIRSALEGDDPVESLTAVERVSEEVYRLALGRLRTGPFVQLAATILAAEASHLVAWRAVR